MAYIKNVWTDQQVERPRTYEMATNSDGSVTLTDSFGNVTDLGTSVNATNMNHIEDGISNVGIWCYSATVTYNQDDVIVFVADNKVTLYKSLVNNNLGNELSDTTKWEKINLGGSSMPILSSMWSDHIINDIQWLRADTFSWQSGDVYKTVYDKLVEEYNATTSVEETEGSITFKRTTNGFKIAVASQESAISSKYNTDGIAWYYILDTTNRRFKLPRTKFGFEGLRTNVGNDIAESLPNIEGNFGYNAEIATTGTGAFTSTGGTQNYAGSRTSVGVGLFNFDASRSSSTYQDNAPVQERATQMYLYFYVGEYSQTATEQTAGLNSELFNNKQDIRYTSQNVSGTTSNIISVYLKTSYVNGTSGYNIWSNGYCEQWGRISSINGTVTVSLLKTYENTNYNVSRVFIDANNTSSQWVVSSSILNPTTNSFQIREGGVNTVAWKISGYLAEGEY